LKPFLIKKSKNPFKPVTDWLFLLIFVNPRSFTFLFDNMGKSTLIFGFNRVNL